MSTTTPHLQIGGRKSKLAVVQLNIVKNLILEKFPQYNIDILALTTLGDQVLNKPLYSFAGKSLWTKELEILLLQAIDKYPKLDLIVHSLKDMPTNLPNEFELGAILTREDPRDALVMKAGSPYKHLLDLPDGSVVGTSSIRRSAQLLKNYPNLKFESVRGNVQTRLNKLDDPRGIFSCLLLANAGLQRLGLASRITSLLDLPEMYYAVGQGALGIEIRSGDAHMKTILDAIRDIPTTYCCLAERSLMRFLEGGCSVPLGVHCTFDEDSSVLTLKSIVVSQNGQEFVEEEFSTVVKSNSDAEAVGITLGQKMLAKGAKEILDKIDHTNINEPPSAIMSDSSAAPSVTNSPSLGSPEPAVNQIDLRPIV